MRIVAWNIGHQTQERPIPAELLQAISALSPDVLVLNEYVHGDSRAQMLAGLARVGLATVHVSQRVTGHNQVLIASRKRYLHGNLAGPSTTPAATANFLHVVTADLEIVGMRAPAYSDRAQLAAYWQETEAIIMRTAERRIIFVGDMNCNPERPRTPGSHALKRLSDAGWHIPSPSGDWSFISKNGLRTSRIDHGICSPMLPNPTAKYVAQINGLVLAGKTSDMPISDHAPLILDVGI